MATCYASQLETTLRRGWPGLILLWGEDAGAIRQATKQIIDQYGVDPTDPFAAETFGLTDLAADPALLPDKAATIPFGGGKRLLRLSGVSGEESASALRPLTEAVTTTLTLPLQDVLILLPVPKLLDKTHALVKAIEKADKGPVSGLSVRFFQDNARDLNAWLQNEVKAAGKSIEPPALALLSAHLGLDREIARRELEKLLIYAGSDQPLTEAHVRATIAGATPADVFKLAEAIGRRDPAATDRIINLMIEQGEDLNSALTTVQRHLQRLALLQASQNPAEVARNLKPPLPPQVQADLVQQAKSYPPRRLAGLSNYVMEALITARSGVLDGQHVLARALLALST